MKPLSDNQYRILEYLKERAGDGVPPSVREICQAVGLRSTSSVQANLDALEEKGYIIRDPMLKRSIRIVGQAENVHHVPLLGVVTAGMPILAVEQVECYLPYSGYVSKDKPLFALHVRGESMLNAGILDGDIIIAEQTPVANNGDIVVALIDDEATVKTFYKENGHFRLQPENDIFEPIIVDEVVILGIFFSKLHYETVVRLNRLLHIVKTQVARNNNGAFGMEIELKIVLRAAYIYTHTNIATLDFVFVK